MKTLIVTVRLAATALMLAAIITLYVHTWHAGGDIWPWDFFGFFTTQNNLGEGTVLVLASLALLRGRPLRWVEYARGAITSYILIVGAVYWTLLAPVDANPVPWSNAVLHGVVPAYAVLDWVLIGDRAPLRWRRYWVIFPYGLLWLAVTLTRGATDGWVPYPFLDPATGYPSVSVYCVAIVVIAGLVGLVFWAVSRYRPIPIAS